MVGETKRKCESIKELGKTISNWVETLVVVKKQMFQLYEEWAQGRYLTTLDVTITETNCKYNSTVKLGITVRIPGN